LGLGLEAVLIGLSHERDGRLSAACNGAQATRN
jgi:hypothetical protein